MSVNKQTIYTKDLANKKLNVVREFDAPVERVWKAWTDPVILDQWWAPKPWKAVTISMDFRDGGRWRYYMAGPEGEKHYCLFDYSTITQQRSYSGLDAFTDENGTISTEMPRMKWKCAFSKSGDGTKVQIEVAFDSTDDLEKIVEMGFKEGFEMAHGNLDEILEMSVDK